MRPYARSELNLRVPGVWGRKAPGNEAVRFGQARTREEECFVNTGGPLEDVKFVAG